jgi:excisionase family DNA binding protein
MQNTRATIVPLWTPEQAAKQLNVEPKTLAQWRSTRRRPLPFVKVGGLVRYRPADVAAFIENHLMEVLA